MMMIAAANVPLVRAMIPILDIMMFALLANHTLIFPTTSPLVLQVLTLTSLCILAMLYLTQMLLVLKRSRKFQLSLIMMTTTATFIGKTPFKPDNTFYMGTFDIHDFTDPKTKQYSYWYHTKLDAQPQLG